jgi:hypothetical protein
VGKRKEPKSAKPKAAAKKTKAKVGKPDTSVLARYSPTDPANAHPDWVRTQFPTYVGPHAGHEATSVREFTHNGHVVKIVTTYRVEVDGKVVHGHMSVDEDGRVYTHATPFVTYASAVDLMKAVINSYPDAFAAGSGGHGGHDHGAGGRS